MSIDPEKGTRGIEMRAAHFPGRAPIDAYGNGGFRFADMSHQGSILCLPDGIYGWNITDHSQLTEDHFERVLDEASGVEVFLLGLGSDIAVVPRTLRSLFSERSIVMDPMSTGAAVRTYNVLLSEGRAIGCGLIAVD